MRKMGEKMCGSHMMGRGAFKQAPDAMPHLPAHQSPACLPRIHHQQPACLLIARPTPKLLELLSGCCILQRYTQSVTPKNVVEFTVPLD
jgi:hypothetical protein